MNIAQCLEKIHQQKMALYAETEKENAKLDAEVAILITLPPELDIIGLVNTPEGWTLTVAGDLAQVLAQLPPCNARMTLEAGSWTAVPEPRPLDWEQQVLALQSTKFGVQWFYVNSGGKILRVVAHKTFLPVPEGYVPMQARHSIVMVRKLKTLPDLARSPSELRTEAWEAFFKQEGYGPGQRTFAYAMRPVSAQNEEITFDMLPQAAKEQSTMQLGDAELVVLRSGGAYAEETVAAGSPFVAFPRMGSFWRLFTPAQATRLIAFLNSQRCNFDECELAAIEAGLESAEQAIAEFQKKYMGCIANSPVSEVLTRFVQEKTGHPVVVEQQDNLRNYPKQVDLALRLWGKSTIVTIDLPEGRDPSGFDFYNPSFYQFVPNNKSLFAGEAALV